MKFEIVRTVNRQWFFRIIAKNGKILCHSENYKQKRSAVEALKLVIYGTIGIDENDIEILY